MKFSRSSLFALAAASFLATPILAATTTGGGVPNLSAAAKSQSEAEASKSSAENTAAANTAAANTAGGSTTGGSTTAANTATGNTASQSNSNSGTASNTDSSSQTKHTGVSIQSTSVIITGSGSSVTGSATGVIPTITGGSSATTGGALPSGLPTVSGAFIIVAPSVPPTANAPYMQVSNMPEGTVFIAVGAILGFLAMSVLLWRGLVAWSLHRSVKRAAAAHHQTDTKSIFQKAPAAPFYKYSDRGSTISLGQIGAKNAKKGGRPTTATNAASSSSLFFSPTAGAAGASAVNNLGNRGSNYLPSGYYAAGAAQPGNGQGMTHIGQGHGAISLSNLGPVRDGYTRAQSMGTTPPDSPMFRPQSSGPRHAYGASSSTLNLNRDGEVRAPSAYLDDLFDGENAPPVPGHGRRESSSHRF